MLEAYDLLPSSFQELVRSFESLDRLYCFLTKRKLAVTFTRLKRLYEEFNKLSTAQEDASSKENNVDCGDNVGVNVDGDVALDHPRASASAAVFNINNLCHISSLCPEHIQIRVYAEENLMKHAPSPLNNNINDDELIELELYFPVNASASIYHSKQRRKTVIDKLFQVLTKHYHTEYVKGDPSDLEKTIKIIRKKGWSIDINQLHCIQLLPPLQIDVLLHVNQYIRQSISSPSTVRQSISSPSTVAAQTSIPSILHATCSFEPTDIRPVSIDLMGGAKAVLEYLKSLPSYRDQLKHVEHCEPREAVYGEIAPPAINSILMDRLKKVLKLDKGLYKHQVKGIDALRQGRHVVVSTSTASGKSLIYNIPIIEAMLNDRQATALYIFPTKALAQDQLRSLLALLQDEDGHGDGDASSLPVRVVACDGDTGIYERSDIQGNSSSRDDHHFDRGATTSSCPINIILTNPDMLHCTMLPDHANWSRIYKNLRYVVIDESHMYGGIFGANVAAVLRRLVRICLHYQHKIPQFICCSATIANPLSHMLKLIPLDCVKPNDDHGDGVVDVVVVDSSDDGAPQCERYISYHYY
jgi:hypothetical protein